MPFALWIWLNGFSKDFVEGPMTSTLSVLFVTKMGLNKQSAQAVLNYFKVDEGFTHLRYDLPKVQRGERGSYFMWQDVVKDLLATGRVKLHLNKTATDVEKEDGAWHIKFTDGTDAGGFKDVVMAMPASVSSEIVRGRPFESFIVGQVDYVDAQVTLHTDHNATLLPKFSSAGEDVLYFVSQEPDHMTGKIARIFGYDDNDLLLTVHGQGVEELPIDPSKILWSTVWTHHAFSLWELLIARKFVPYFNGKGGLHYAGDWVYGVGHNDAIKAGVAAACSVGVRKEPVVASAQPLYTRLLDKMCSV